MPAEPSAARLEVAGLSAGYRGRPVLDGVDLEVRGGEIVGLLGPNGAGKSTLVRVLSGGLAYRGSARVEGDEVRALERRELARRVAVVPQEASFGFAFSVLEVVLMGRHPHLAGLAFETSADLDRARDALARAGAAALAERSIHALSTGERQRVLFARSLAQEPRSLLLDEPASHLDLRHQVELYDRVREEASRGVAVLTVLHDLNLAAEYCDRIVLLDGGRVAAAGATESVLTYANLTRVYGTEVYVDLHDLTGKPVIVPLSGRVREGLRRGRGQGSAGSLRDAST